MAGVGDHDTIYPPVGYRWLAYDKTRLNPTIDHVHHGRARNRDHVGKFGLRQRRATVRRCYDRHPTGRTNAHVVEATIHRMPPTSRDAVQTVFTSLSKVGRVARTLTHYR